MSQQTDLKNSILSKWLKKNKDIDNDTIRIRQDRTFAPLSDAQKRLWLLQHLYPNNPFYNFVDENVIIGDLDIDLLKKSIQNVTKQHESLNTNIIVQNNEVVQHIKQHQDVKIVVKDFSKDQSLSKAKDFITHESLKSFNLEHDKLLRAFICKISETHHLLFFIIHHIIIDKWSMALLREQICDTYLSSNKNEFSNKHIDSFQFGDYTYWLKQKASNETQIEYWKQKLSGELNALDLPYDFSRPLIPSFKGSTITKKLDQKTYLKLKKFSLLKNTTHFVSLLTTFKTLLYKYSAQNDIIVGIPVTGRNRKELESIIGFFDETLPLRSKISGELSFSEVLDGVKQTTSEAISNKDISFETIVKTINPERSLNVNPIFQVMFIYDKHKSLDLVSKDFEWDNKVFDYKVSKFDLTLYASESDSGLELTFEYSHDLFKESTIEKMLNHLENCLDQTLEHPDLKIRDLSLLSESEKNELITIGRNNPSPIVSNEITLIHHFFENEVIKNPDKTAVISNDKHYSYEYINKKSNALARRLNTCGVKVNERIGLCIDQSVEMITGILGILKAGACYVPIAVDAPKDRVNFIIEDADIAQIVIGNETLHLFEDRNLQLHALQDLNPDESDFSNFKGFEKPNLAYTLYTSGSTGQPKGVTVTHSNLIHSTASRFSFYDKQPERFLLLSSFTFDSSIAGIFWTLSSGNTLIIPEKRIEQDMFKLGNLIRQHDITHTLLLPSLYKVILENIEKQYLASLKTVIVAGEECSTKVCQSHFDTLPNVALYNEYGPTEATVWAIAHQVKATDKFMIPVGKPIPYVKLYVLDHDLNLVPKGVKGELYIGGPNVVLGYLNNDFLTKQHFIQNPFSSKGKDILYKTGDVVKINNDDNFEFHGRKDHQVKLRGFRIELEEISRVIKQHPSVQEVVTILDEGISVKDNLNEIDELDYKLNQLEEHQALLLLDSISNISEDKQDMLYKESNI